VAMPEQLSKLYHSLKGKPMTTFDRTASLLALSILLSVTILTACSSPPPTATATRPPTSETRPEWAKYFQAYNVTGAFVLYDLNRNQYLRFNPEQCGQRFIPASTFKIMNAMIGLETGVIPDADYVIKWDGTRYDIPEWNRDHTLRTAMQNSVVWYYQELARRVGKERMQHYIDAVKYGNQDISGQIDSFWLDGGLRISPDEQIEFLKRLYKNDLPFSSKTMATVKDLIMIEKTDRYTLRAKTGWALRVKTQVGWFVGYLEQGGNVYFFANNYESDSPSPNFGNAREEITRSVLRDMGLLH
jgi:beta-lactamase class D